MGAGKTTGSQASLCSPSVSRRRDWPFDWIYEYAVLGGVLQAIKVAHFRLFHSRKMFLVAYPRETQEMALATPIRAFAYVGGVPRRMAYGNLKKAVAAILCAKGGRSTADSLPWQTIICWSRWPVRPNPVGERPSRGPRVTPGHGCLRRLRSFQALTAPMPGWLCVTKRWRAASILLRQGKGDHAFVGLFLVARSLGGTGMETLEVAGDLTLQTGVVATAIVPNGMRRLAETARLEASPDRPA